jgi:V8-like Glu-specific endopeptidase
MMRTAALFALTTALMACDADDKGFEAPSEDPAQSELYYGSDDRLDYYELSDPAEIAMADATVALMDQSYLSRSGSGYSIWTGGTLRSDVGVCTSEPFWNQPTSASCSGVLIGDDLIATAGHCISSSNCGRTRFVFNYKMNNANNVNDFVSTNDVYSCDRIVSRQNSTSDWAVVRLDRPVVGHTPAEIRRTGTVPSGTSLVLSGFPAGLPLKVAGNATVRNNSSSIYFEANVDSYGGNSGSPVFNANTGVVEGLLVRGNNDWNWNGSCYVSNSCPNGGCPGHEDVTRTTQFDQYVPQIVVQPACTDDNLENNDNINNAATLTAGSYDLEICGAGDDDWYDISLTAGQTLDLEMRFTHAQGNLDMELFVNGNSFDVSESTDDIETLTYTANGATTVSLRVYGYNDAQNDYSLDVVLSGGAPTVGDGFSLSGSPTVNRGDWYTFNLTDAPENERVFLLTGATSPSRLPGCPVDLDIQADFILGSPFADAIGQASVTLQIPSTLARGTYRTQAASIVDCSVSNTFDLTVQ